MRKNLQQDIMALGGDIVASGRFARAQGVPHHSKDENIQTHSLETAALALAISRWLGRRGIMMNETDIVRASLLHDIGMTEKSVSGQPSYVKAYTHPRAGVRIARDEFGANKNQTNAISHHMWPICVVPPKTREGWTVLVADKLYSLAEAYKIVKRRIGRVIGN